MQLTASEIIERLGGTNASARFFNVRPPSVSGWLEAGGIPQFRLIESAARLERITGGWFSRQAQFPHSYCGIWPELEEVESLRAQVAQLKERLRKYEPDAAPALTGQAQAAINSEALEANHV